MTLALLAAQRENYLKSYHNASGIVSKWEARRMQAAPNGLKILKEQSERHSRVYHLACSMISQRQARPEQEISDGAPRLSSLSPHSETASEMKHADSPTPSELAYRREKQVRDYEDLTLSEEEFLNSPSPFDERQRSRYPAPILLSTEYDHNTNPLDLPALDSPSELGLRTQPTSPDGKWLLTPPRSPVFQGDSSIQGPTQEDLKYIINLNRFNNETNPPPRNAVQRRAFIQAQPKKTITDAMKQRAHASLNRLKEVDTNEEPDDLVVIVEGEDSGDESS